MSMTLEEKAVFADNGIRCQVAMHLECGGEHRDALDAMAMSLPLATALAITKIKVGATEDEEPILSMWVDLVPEALAVEEMFNKVSEICEQAFEVFFFGDKSDVHFLAAETQQASVNEISPVLEGMSVPGRKVVLLDGEVME